MENENFDKKLIKDTIISLNLSLESLRENITLSSPKPNKNFKLKIRNKFDNSIKGYIVFILDNVHSFNYITPSCPIVKLCPSFDIEESLSKRQKSPNYQFSQKEVESTFCKLHSLKIS